MLTHTIGLEKFETSSRVLFGESANCLATLHLAFEKHLFSVHPHAHFSFVGCHPLRRRRFHGKVDMNND
jgi:hypothetical protein